MGNLKYSDARTGISAPNSVVYRETIRSLQQARKHYDNAFRTQAATIDEQTEEIRCLKATIDVHLGTIADQDRNISDSRAVAAAGETEKRKLSLLHETQAGTMRSLMDEVRQLIGELHEDGDRYRKRIFALDIDVGNLKDWLAEAEAERDQLQTRLDDLEDPPIEEPQRPEGMESRHGTEVTPRDWGREAGL